jgi:sister chromatid cohesion protein DCC1
MSTQNEEGIEFSIIPEAQQQHYRLLELPPELLEVVTSSNASP